MEALERELNAVQWLIVAYSQITNRLNVRLKRLMKRLNPLKNACKRSSKVQMREMILNTFLRLKQFPLVIISNHLQSSFESFHQFYLLHSSIATCDSQVLHSTGGLLVRDYSIPSIIYHLSRIALSELSSATQYWASRLNHRKADEASASIAPESVSEKADDLSDRSSITFARSMANIERQPKVDAKCGVQSITFKI